jgi:predicted RNA-binding protein with PUA-like domain
MTTQYWLVKSEPEAYSWADFAKERRTQWTGVRNFAARNNLKAMRRGDRVLFYESVTTKAVVGVAEVAGPAFPDSTAKEGDWFAVELKAIDALPRPVTLDEIKAEPLLTNMALLKNSRLSVQPVTRAEFDRVLKLAAIAPLK